MTKRSPSVPRRKSKRASEVGPRSDPLGYGLKQIAKMTLGSGNMQLAVELPDGEDLNEWLAVNTIEFYNESKRALPKSMCCTGF